MSSHWAEMPGPDEIHVWEASVDRAAREPAALTGVERRVADEIQGARARARYIAGRTLLRRRLGELLGCDPLVVDIVEGADGKPALAEPMLSFNVSHAGDVILIALSRPRRLGVDVERIRPEVDARAVIEELLDATDRDEVTRAVAEDGLRGFFRYWTRYEALVKARGEGLVLPLRGFAEMAAGFDLRELDVTAGYVAAVVADGSPWRIVRCPEGRALP